MIRIITEGNEVFYISEKVFQLCVLAEPSMLNKNPQAKNVIIIPGVNGAQVLAKHEFDRLKLLMDRNDSESVN